MSQHTRIYRPGAQPAAAAPAEPRDVSLSDRPLAGILVSRSRTELGEIFPVYVGRNTIGSAPDRDVRLREESVSPNHAVLLIRVVPGPEGDVAQVSITDYDSEHGTTLNGLRLGYDKEELQAGDRLGFGLAYECLWIPIVGDGLRPAPGFSNIPLPKPEPGQIYARPSQPDMARRDEPVYPNAVDAANEAIFYGRSKKKEEDHSAKLTITNDGITPPKQ